MKPSEERMLNVREPYTKGLSNLKRLLSSHDGGFWVYKHHKVNGVERVFEVILKDGVPTMDLSRPLSGSHMMHQPCAVL